MKKDFNPMLFPALSQEQRREFIFNKDSIDDISTRICKLFDADINEVRGNGRYRRITELRQMIMFFLRARTNFSHYRIGCYFGGRHHSTVVNSCQTASDLISTSKNFALRYRMVIDLFDGQIG